MNEVRKKYKHFKLRFASAAHIMMAYCLAGTNMAYDEDYYDDHEYGGGRRLHRILQDEDKHAVMLIVVRYFSQTLLGPARFKRIHSVATQALKNLNDNHMVTSSLKLHQKADT